VVVLLRDEAAVVEETSVARASIIATPKKEEQHDAIINIDHSIIIKAISWSLRKLNFDRKVLFGKVGSSRNKFQ
jgi:hypothetical protein